MSSAREPESRRIQTPFSALISACFCDMNLSFSTIVHFASVPIDVIGGHEEARLIYLGVAHELPRSLEPRLVVDIGGGSTEFIIGRALEPERLASLKIGCVGITQRFFPEGRLSAEGFDAATVNKVIKLIDRSEYKRRQAAPGLKVTSRAFGFGRRMPIAQNYVQRLPQHGEPSPVLE